MNIQALARPDILAMAPYESARGGAAADGVLLNANEAPYPLIDAPLCDELSLNRYPPPQPGALRARLARLYGVPATEVLVTRGSDEGIDLLTRVFCRAGQDAVLECPPCFGMYRVAAQIQGVDTVSVTRDPASLEIDFDTLAQTILDHPNVRLVFLTRPNNPTGDMFGNAELERILAASVDRALVVLDEAYIEFSDAGSAASWVQRFPNLVVLRTLSKAWAAAGLRCGAVIADPAVIDLLGRVMAPYPLSAPAIALALAATEPEVLDRQAAMLRELAANKARLVEFLATRDWVHASWPGKANFVLIRVEDGPGLVRHCAERGVRLRDFSRQPLLENCVRLTVGADGDLQALLAALRQWSTPA